MSSISWKEDRTFECFDGSLVSDQRVLHLWFSFYSWPDNRPTKMLCNCGTEFGRLSCRSEMHRSKSIGPRIDLWRTKNVRLLGHLFEQSGNDYLVAGRSPEKGLKEKMTKSFVIRRVFSFYTELFGIPLKSWRELSVQLHLFSLLGVDRLVYP